MNPTFEEKKAKEGKYANRQNTAWSEEITKACKHKWQPVQMRMEIGDREMPDINNAKVYCVCMKCCSHTYIVTGWVGYYLNSPDLLEEK
jgi:hypothetical protein